MELLNSKNRVEQMKQIQKTGLELFTKKNTDYGDAFAKFGLIGVLMRIEDKNPAMSISITFIKNINVILIDIAARSNVLYL